MNARAHTIEDLRLAIANANEIAASLGLPPVAAMPAGPAVASQWAPDPPPAVSAETTTLPNRVRWWVGDGDRWWRIGEESAAKR